MPEYIKTILDLVKHDFIYWSNFILPMISFVISVFTLVQVLIIKRRVINKKAIRYLNVKLKKMEKNVKTGNCPSDLPEKVQSIVKQLNNYISIFSKWRIKKLTRFLPKKSISISDIQKTEMAIHSIINEFEDVEM